MNFKNLIFVLFVALAFGACTSNKSNNAIETEIDSISYIIGAADGERLNSEFQRSKFDSLLNMDLYFEGLMSAANVEDLKMEPDSSQEFLNAFYQEYRMYMMTSMQDTTGAVTFDKSASLIDSVSYLMGAGGGKALLASFESAGLDTIIDLGLYLDGFSTSAHAEELRIPTEENMAMVNAFFQDFQERQMASEFGPVKKAGEEYLAKNGALSEVTVTASGLQYEVIVEGNGPKPTFSDQVKVHYHGTLVDGEVFDSSVERGEPTTFGVGQVIRGWTEALQLMPVGSKWKLTIPADLAYGTQAPRGSSIKPYSVLVFEVELLAINE